MPTAKQIAITHGGLVDTSPSPAAAFAATHLAHEQRAQADANQHKIRPPKPSSPSAIFRCRPRSLEALSRHENRCQRAYNQALDRLLKIQATRPKNPARQSAKREIFDTKPIFETNKELTIDQKPIQSLNEASSKPQRTGVKPGSNPSRIPVDTAVFATARWCSWLVLRSGRAANFSANPQSSSPAAHSGAARWR
jgi:hypothetical protein